MIEPRLIAQTEEWIALDKPAGWQSVPGRGKGPVVVEWARERFGAALPVHRLDIGTSGVILLARDAAAHRKANLWFQEREVRKHYDCLAVGAPRDPVFQLRTPVDGSAAASRIEVRVACREGFLGRVIPMTGRRHQIRVQLSEAGHPLWGDATYGGPKTVEFGSGPLSVDRVALHASRLELPSGERFEAPWPEDFARWFQRLEKEGIREGA